MNAIYLHPVDGFTFLENVPEKPKTVWSEPYKNEEREEAYERALAECIEKRMVIGNPEVITAELFPEVITDGDLKLWPGTYKKEFEPQPNHPTAYGIDIIRLIAPEPVNSSMSETYFRWVKATDRLPQHMVKVPIKYNGMPYAAHYDYSLKRFMLPNFGPSGHPIDGVEWLEEISEPVVSQDQEEQVKQIASIAWKGAANAFRMYPENKHTFAQYWESAKSQFKEFLQ